MADATKELEIVLRLKDELSAKLGGAELKVKALQAATYELDKSGKQFSTTQERQNAILQRAIELNDKTAKAELNNLSSIQRLDKATQQLNHTHQNLQKGQGASTRATVDFSRVLQDSVGFQYSFSQGMMGIANNLDPFRMSMQSARQEMGSWGAVAKSLFSGTGGMILGFNAIVLAAQVLPGLFKDTAQEVSRIEEAFGRLAQISGGYKGVVFDEEEARRALQSFKDEVYRIDQLAAAKRNALSVELVKNGQQALTNKLSDYYTEKQKEEIALAQSGIIVLTEQIKIREAETVVREKLIQAGGRTREQIEAEEKATRKATVARIQYNESFVTSPDKGDGVDEKLLEAKNKLRLKKKERDETLMLTRVFDTQYNGIQGISDAELEAIRLAGIERQKEQDKALQKELQILQAKQDAVQRFGTAVSGYLADWVLNGERLSTVLSRAAEYFERKILETVADKAVQALLGKVLGGGSGFLGSILGWLGWADGGYTGSGSRNEVAGVVHKGEYVIPQSMVQSSPQLISAIENKRTGYASGGMVGGNTININITADSTSSGKRIVKEIQGYMRQIGVNTLAEIPARA